MLSAKFSSKISDYSKYDGIVVDKTRAKDLKLNAKKIQTLNSGNTVFLADKNIGKEALALAEKFELKNVAIIPAKDKESVLQAEFGVLLNAYQYLEYKSEKSRAKPKFTLISDHKPSAKAVASSVCYARDLVNRPASDLTPKHMAQEAKKLFKSVKVYSEAELKKMGAGGILAVSKGSSTPPCLIHFKIGPQNSKKQICFIGKGVTYDSGGYSLKSAQGMETMKCDMAGAAAVMGLLHYISKHKPKYTVHGLIPCAENMVNSDAQKPGDVYTALDGTTVEVLNTDAEGRLLLADAITFAQKKLKVTNFVTLATLTGAVIAALGDHYAGLFGNDESFTKQVKEAADNEQELIWELPLAEKYRSKLKSTVADIKNNPGSPGAITAALFLEHFVKKGSSWAHIDLAGPAFLSEAHDLGPKGATGYGVRTLVNLVS